MLVSSVILRFLVLGAETKFFPSVEETISAFLDLRVVMGPKIHSLHPY